MPRSVRCEIVKAGPEETSGRPPLLFVHGARHAAWCWMHWQAALARDGWRSAAVSLRGHGLSAGSLSGATLGAYAADVMGAARALGEPPVLIGHSMGGIISQRVVHRIRARGMALLAPAPAHSGTGFAIGSTIRKPRSLLPIFIGRPIHFERGDLLSADVPDTEAESVLARLDGESALAQFQIAMPRRPPRRAGCPVIVIGAPGDRVIPAAHVARTARLQGVEVDWCPGLEHDIMLEPGGDAVLAMLAEWLETTVLGTVPAGPA